MKRAIVVVLGLHFLFILSAFLMSPDQMSEVLRGALIIACGFGIVRWGVGAWEAFKTAGKRTSAAILAVVTLLLGIVAISVYAVLFARYGRPDTWVRMYWAPYFVAYEVVGAILLVVSTRFEGEKPTKLDAPLAAIIAFMGIMLTTFGPWLLSKLGLIWHILAGVMPRI